MFLFTAPRPRFYYAFRQVPRAASVSTTLFLAVQIRNRTTAMNTQDKPKTFRECKAIMKQPYEQVWTNHYQQSKPTTGAQKPDVCGCHGEHLEGCSNAGRPFKPTTGQEWTAENFTKPRVSKATITWRKNSTPASPPSGRRLARLPKTQGNCISTISNSAHN